MAKAQALKVIRVPSFAGARSKAKGLARRGFTAAARRAAAQRHRFVAIVAAAALGFAKRQNVKLPTPAGMSPALAYGVGAALLSGFVKSPTLDHAATGLLAVAAHEFASGESSVSGDEDDEVSGEV